MTTKEDTGRVRLQDFSIREGRPALIALILGLCIGFAVLSRFDEAVADTEAGVWLIRMMLLPVVLPYLAVTFARRLHASAVPVRLFVQFSAGLEVGYLILAWQVLMYWFRNPDEAQLEPLFVATGAALAVLEYCQVSLRGIEA
jgi:hypothetical protein